MCGFGNVCAGEDDDYEELKDAIPTSITVDAPASGSPTFGSPPQLFRAPSKEQTRIPPFKEASALGAVQNLVSVGPQPPVPSLQPPVPSLVSAGTRPEPAGTAKAGTAPSGAGSAGDRAAGSTAQGTIPTESSSLAPQTVAPAALSAGGLVEAGIVLEQVGGGGGAWRVKAVAARSPCARQGACDEVTTPTGVPRS